NVSATRTASAPEIAAPTRKNPRAPPPTNDIAYIANPMTTGYSTTREKYGGADGRIPRSAKRCGTSERAWAEPNTANAASCKTRAAASKAPKTATPFVRRGPSEVVATWSNGTSPRGHLRRRGPLRHPLGSSQARPEFAMKVRLDRARI